MQSPILSNPPQTPIKTYHDTHGMLTPTVYSTVQPVTLQPIPTNSYNQTIRSNQYQSNQSYQPYQNYSINQNNVIGNLEHTRQISTVTPYQIQAGQVMQSTFVQPQQQIVYRNFGNIKPTQTVHVVQPVQHVQQALLPIRKSQTVNTVISRPQILQTVQPEIQTIVKHQYQQQPKVQLSGNSRWDSYYTGQKYYAKPPVTTSVQQPTSCHPAILGILGLLALAGLIIGIILAARAYTGYGNIQGGNTQVQGIPAVDVSTSFTPGIFKNNGSVSTSASSGAQIKPTYVNPVTVPPYTKNVGQSSSRTNTASQTSGTTPTYFAPINTQTTNTASFAPASSSTTSQTYFAPTPISSLKTTQTTSTTNSFSTQPKTSTTTFLPQNRHMKLRHRLGVF